MSKKVIDRNTQSEAEVTSSDAQDAVLRGDAALTEGTQTVVKGDQVMDVPTAKLAEAVDLGWSLADDEEAAGVILRREESDFASGLQGGAEAALAGASLGLSTAALEALGADPERMRARREALGTVGTGLELAGAVAPAIFTGGGSAAAGAAARGGIRGALRYTPAGLLESGAAGLERAAGRALADAPGLVRTVIPVAGRGAVEGFVSGAGAQLHEDVLGQRDLSVDRLLGAGGTAAILGGAGGALVHGVSGAALAGTKLSREAAGKVLQRATGVVDDLSSGQGHFLEKALADGNTTAIAKLLGVPEESVSTLLPSLRAAAKGDTELYDLLQAGGSTRFEEDLAGDMRAPITDVRDAVDDLRAITGRRNKVRTAASKIEHERRGPAIVATAQKVDEFASHIDVMLARNAEFGGELYEEGVLRQLKANAVRARKEIDEAVAGAKAQFKNGVADYDEHSIGLTVGAADALKRDADNLIAKVRTSAQRSGSIKSQNTIDALYGEADDAVGSIGALRKHLEDEELLGSFGTAQKESNAAMRAAISARKDLGDTATRRVLDRTRQVDNRDLLSIVRSGGRFRGEQVTENFRNVIRKEIEAAQTIAKHNELTPEQTATLNRAIAAEKKLDDAYEAQRSKVDRLDAAEMWRNAEGNRSVSIGSASSVGAEMIERAATGVGATLGGLVAGPAGAIAGGAVGRGVGYVAGMAKRPYTLLRKYTAIMKQINDGEKGQIAAVAGFVNKMGKGASRAARAATPYAAGAGRGIRAATTRAAGMSAAKIRDRNDKALERAQQYAQNPSLLADDMRGATLNMEDVAPSMSAAAAAHVANAASFLVSKAPTTWEDPLGRVKLVDKHSQAKFDRYAETVLDPMSVLARMQHGTLSQEHVEALKEVYPAMYADVQRRVMEAMMEAESVPFQVRITAGVMFESAADALMQPELIATTQGAIASSGKPPDPSMQPPQTVRASGAPSPKSTAAYSTGAGRIESGASRMI